jgi:glycosyltransferase involved in cell wall biosynthesis
VILRFKRFNSPPLPVVNNGVDFGQFYSASERRRNETPTIGLLYSPARNKGYEDLLEIIGIVSKTIPNTKVLAYGTIPPPRIIENMEFHQQPKQDSLRDIYCQCDVWLCASTSEGFHLPPHEAMACRTPVVSTNVGGPCDMIEHGVDGYLRFPGENDKLAADVVEVLTSASERWRQLSEAAFAKAKQYTWKQAAINFRAALN